MKLILGSSSVHRRRVLKNSGYVFEVMSPDIDEKAIRSDDFYRLPLLIARAKAEALKPRVPNTALLITADQVVVCGGKLHEKPKDIAEARLFLQRYSKGFSAETVSALCVTDISTGKQVEGVDRAKVHFGFIPEIVINQYVNTEDALTNAGGFAIESPILTPYISMILGTKDSVFGMPLALLQDLLQQVI